MPKISAIVPVYKVEKYLVKCINSILFQSFSDFELILVDDGSIDECAKICDTCILTDNRIIVIHKRNNGVSAARNNGLTISKGEYITVIDSDDWVLSNYLEQLYSSCLRNNAQISVCDYVLAKDTAENPITCVSDDEVVFTNREAVQFYAEKLFDNRIAQFRIPVAKLVKRDIVMSHTFPIDRVFAEDAACVYLWLWTAERIVHVNYSGYYYFQNPNGICRKPLGEFFLGNFLTEEEWIDFFKEKQFDSLYLKTCHKYILESANACQVADSEAARGLFRKVLRGGLKKYARLLGLHPETNEWVYEMAYPRLMQLYWIKLSLKRKIGSL